MNEEEKINQPTDDSQPSTENKSVDGETSIVNEEQQTKNLLPDRQAHNYKLKIWKYIIHTT